MLKSEECSTCVKRDCVTLLTSLAKGGGDSVISLCDYGACEAVLLGILLTKVKEQKNFKEFEDEIHPLKSPFYYPRSHLLSFWQPFDLHVQFCVFLAPKVSVVNTGERSKMKISFSVNSKM